MAWTAIVNPAAGRGRTRRLLDDLAARLHAAPVEVAVHVAGSFDDAADTAAKAAAGGDDLVACGGDGLVGLLAGAAAEAGVRLAVVPTGAGNDFATSLGHDPRHPLDAVAALTRGHDRRVDLGRANGSWYAGVTCSGFDAEANRWANDVSWLSGTPLYVVAVFRTLVRYRPQRFRVVVDGAVHEHDAWMVSVGNNDRYAGGMRITPDARLDDGLLDVCVVDGSLSPLGLVREFPKVFAGRHVHHPAVTILRGREITVEPVDSPLPLEVWADGERVGPLPATIVAVPGALTVRVPARA
jgi:diacylglycerol kinase (ATP)